MLFEQGAWCQRLRKDQCLPHILFLTLVLKLLWEVYRPAQDYESFSFPLLPTRGLKERHEMFLLSLIQVPMSAWMKRWSMEVCWDHSRSRSFEVSGTGMSLPAHVQTLVVPQAGIAWMPQLDTQEVQQRDARRKSYRRLLWRLLIHCFLASSKLHILSRFQEIVCTRNQKLHWSSAPKMALSCKRSLWTANSLKLVSQPTRSGFQEPTRDEIIHQTTWSTNPFLLS